jgi:hypothetical protein
MPTPPAPRIIDARGLLPPEPMELTLGALDELEPDGEIHLLLYREPARGRSPRRSTARMRLHQAITGFPSTAVITA